MCSPLDTALIIVLSVISEVEGVLMTNQRMEIGSYLHQKNEKLVKRKIYVQKPRLLWDSKFIGNLEKTGPEVFSQV